MRLSIKTLLGHQEGCRRSELPHEREGKRIMLDYSNLSSIHSAAWGGRRKEVLDLLAAGADVNATESGGRTPLMNAASKGRVAMVRLLIEKGADVRRRENSGWTAMDLAVFWRRLPMIKVLRDAHTPHSFRTAAMLGDVQAVLWLLAGEPHHMPDALCQAAWAGKTTVLSALLKQGGDIHQTFSRHHYGLLSIAAGQGQNAMVRFLLRHGVDIDTKDALVVS